MLEILFFGEIMKILATLGLGKSLKNQFLTLKFETSHVKVMASKDEFYHYNYFFSEKVIDYSSLWHKVINYFCICSLKAWS